MFNKGVYKNSPGETMKACKYCHREFHHQGIGPHQVACVVKSPEQRQQYFKSTGKYAWAKMRHGVRELYVPATATILSSRAPKKNRHPLATPISMIESGGKRFAVTLSFDANDIRDVATRLLRNAKLENVNIR